MGIFNSRYLIAIGIIIHLLWLISLGTGFLNEFFYDSSHFHKGQAADFFVFYNASRLLLKQKSIYGPKDAGTPYMYGRYTYIPTFVMLTFWLGLPGPFLSYFLWAAIIEITLLLSIMLSIKWKRKKGYRISDEFIIFLWLIPSPFYLELFMGQNTFIFAFFLLVFLISKDISKNRAIPVISFSLSVISKIASIICTPIFLKNRQYAVILIPALIAVITSLFYFTAIDREKIEIIGTEKIEKQVPADKKTTKGDKSSYKMPMVSRGDHTEDRIFIKSPVEFRIRVPKGIYITLHHIGRKPKTLFYPQVPGFSSFLYNITRSISFMRYFAVIMWIAVYSIILLKPSDYILDFGILIILFFLTFTFIWEHHYTLLMPFIILLIIREYAIRVPLLIAYFLIAVPTPFFLYNPDLCGILNMDANLIKDIFYYIPKSAGVLLAFVSALYLKFNCSMVTDEKKI